MKTLTILFVLLCGTLNANVLYEEDFSDGAADGITIDSGNYQVIDGVFRQPSCCHAVFSLDGVPSDNISLELDFLISSPGHGDFDVYLNTVPFEDNLDYNRYQITNAPAGSDGPQSSILSIPGSAVLDTTPNIINARQMHSLRINRYGSNIDVFLNGDLFMQTSQATNHGGVIKFRSWDAVSVDNIKVSVHTPEPSSIILMLVGVLFVWRMRI